MFRILLLSLFCVFTAVNASASAYTCFELFEKESIEPPEREITIWRYEDQNMEYQQDPFSVASVTSWRWNGEAYELAHLGRVENDYFVPAGSTYLLQYENRYMMFHNPIKRELESGSRGQTLFEKNQDFPLTAMEDINYIDSKVRKDQIKVRDQLSPNQVVFFEYTVKMPRSQLIELFGAVPNHARLDPEDNAWVDYQNSFARIPAVDYFEPGKVSTSDLPPQEPDLYYQLKTGSSWLLSGQNIATDPLPLPLENGLNKAIDRQQMKYIWEVGRAGQLKGELGRSHAESGAFAETLKASAHFALRELLQLGGDLSEAYVFAHSLKPLHTRMYKSLFGMEIYSTYKNDPNEVVLVAPLSEMLRRFPPEHFTMDLNQLRRSSQVRKNNNPLSPLESYKLHFNHRQNLTTFLETKAGSVVILRDFSYLAIRRALLPYESRFLGGPLKHHALENLESALRSQHPALLSSDYLATELLHKQKQNKIPYSQLPDENLRRFLYRNRALEIQLKPENGESPRDLTILALRFLISQLQLEGFENPLQTLKDLGVQIAITSKNGHPFVALQPTDVWSLQTFVVDYGFSSGLLGNGFGGGTKFFRSGTPFQSSVFQIDDILSLSLSSEMELLKGPIHHRQHLYMPELYSGD